MTAWRVRGSGSGFRWVTAAIAGLLAVLVLGGKGRSTESSKEERWSPTEQAIKAIVEAEAERFLQHAFSYYRMGTSKTKRSAKFLFKEIVRRYPQTPQARVASLMLDGDGQSKGWASSEAILEAEKLFTLARQCRGLEPSLSQKYAKHYLVELIKCYPNTPQAESAILELERMLEYLPDLPGLPVRILPSPSQPFR